MATQTIRVTAPIAAGSYTVNVQTDGSNTNAFTGRTLTAESISSFWTFTVTSATAGLYAFQVLNGSSAVVAYGWFYSGTDSAVTIQDSNSRDDALNSQRIGTPSGASLAVDIAAVKTDTGNLVTRITANLFSGITYLKNWLGTLAGKTADATTLAEINATTAGATYANTTDSLEAIRDNTGSGGITAGDIEDIVDGVSASLTAPGFAASIAIQEGTYATVADVEARLTVYGVTLAADVDEYDGTRGSDELQMIEVAIEYANSLIDEHIVDLLHPISNRSNATFTRPSGVSWLRDRCVDIACYRLATLGGRTASDVLAGDYASALERLKKAREQTIRIPNLIYTSPTRPYATEYGGGIGIVRRAGT